MKSALTVVGLALLGTALPLGAQTLKLPVSATRTEVSPVRTQEYETVHQPGQVDSTTQATNLQFKNDQYERLTVPVRDGGPRAATASQRAQGHDPS